MKRIKKRREKKEAQTILWKIAKGRGRENEKGGEEERGAIFYDKF